MHHSLTSRPFAPSLIARGNRGWLRERHVAICRSRVRTQFETQFSVGSYLAYQGDRFVERFDANSYLTLTMAMDLFDLGITPEKLAAALGRSRLPVAGDQLYQRLAVSAFQSREIVDAPDRRRASRSATATSRATAATMRSCCPTNWRSTGR